jgi:hypothetical protein
VWVVGAPCTVLTMHMCDDFASDRSCQALHGPSSGFHSVCGFSLLDSSTSHQPVVWLSGMAISSSFLGGVLPFSRCKVVPKSPALLIKSQAPWSSPCKQQQVAVQPVYIPCAALSVLVRCCRLTSQRHHNPQAHEIMTQQLWQLQTV